MAVRLVLDQESALPSRGVTSPSVAAADKIVSIFEPHTDIVVKGGRQTEFGHKVFLTSGRSGLVLDCTILRGNPADTTLVDEFLERHAEVYGQVPAQSTFDGGFTSKRNLRHLKDAGIKDAMFHKKRGLAVSDMVESPGAYGTLRAFRAGIESGISWLKRSFGWTRCRWSGLPSFEADVWSSVLATNLLVMARSRLA